MIPVYEAATGLIFDCDGTLADTMAIHMDAWQKTMKRYGYDCPVDFLRPLNGMPAEEIVVRFNQKYGANLDARIIAREKENLTYENLTLAQPIPAVAKIARDFRGKLPMCVVSGGTAENVRRTLKAIAMADFFETVITADDGLKPKPDPQMFLEAAKRMSVAPNGCVVFEDGDAGIAAGFAAGMHVVDVRPYIHPKRSSSLGM